MNWSDIEAIEPTDDEVRVKDARGREARIAVVAAESSEPYDLNPERLAGVPDPAKVARSLKDARSLRALVEATGARRKGAQGPIGTLYEDNVSNRGRLKLAIKLVMAHCRACETIVSDEHLETFASADAPAGTLTGSLCLIGIRGAGGAGDAIAIACEWAPEPLAGVGAADVTPWTALRAISGDSPADTAIATGYQPEPGDPDAPPGPAFENAVLSALRLDDGLRQAMAEGGTAYVAVDSRMPRFAQEGWDAADTPPPNGIVSFTIGEENSHNTIRDAAEGESWSFASMAWNRGRKLCDEARSALAAVAATNRHTAWESSRDQHGSPWPTRLSHYDITPTPHVMTVPRIPESASLRAAASAAITAPGAKDLDRRAVAEYLAANGG